MDLNTSDCSEPSVDEGAFWHANMDLYYGYLAGEVVEVEHEPNKYWLASIQYCFKHLVLLRWLGNYGNEFWVDTSMTNIANSSSGALNEISNPKRLFPLGHHLQSQLKSQFKLEIPSRILTKPSLYDPSRDPYADIRTIHDLLAHEVEEHNNDDAFAVKSTSDTASLALAKCKTKISYGQEDQDELEAALQSLTGSAQYDESGGRAEAINEEKTDQLEETTISKESLGKPNSDMNGQVKTEPVTDSSEGDSSSDQDIDQVLEALKNPKLNSESLNEVKKNKQKLVNDSDHKAKDNHSDALVEMCKVLQDKAINEGRYDGVGPAANGLDFNLNPNIIYFSKPKQFYDVGGANQERLFVPGTLLEVAHIEENQSGQLDLSHWFAFVVKNVGGRLTLRWFLCDEPKFKQGRLEMKSSRSRFVLEDSDQPIDGDNSSDGHSNKISNNIDSNTSTTKQNCISSKSITFSMHFCDPKIHTILHAKSLGGNYKLPHTVSTSILDSQGPDFLSVLTDSQMEYVFDARRMNLDRDRPLINHILSTCRLVAPTYLDLIFAPKDKTSKREVLMSCPKITKLLKAYVKRELHPGVFEIHSEPLAESGEVIKIIYPYESSFAILPLDWANNHEDCLSINPSRNPSPVNPSDASDKRAHKKVKQDREIHENSGQIMETDAVQNQVVKPDEISTETNSCSDDPIHKETLGINEVCLRKHRSAYATKKGFFDVTEARLVSLPFNLDKMTNEFTFEDSDPASWLELLRKGELMAPSFHCCLDYSQKEAVESRFKVMDQLEVVHPSSDSIICTGRIRKVVFPLIWIQISADCYTLVPFNSTNIYSTRWCETNNHKLISLLPPRKRCATKASSQQNSDLKRRKKAKVSNDSNPDDSKDQKLAASNLNDLYEKEHFDLGALNDRQAGIDYILNEKSAYIKIFFNHKCFTGPSLSKSKICSLPQYVGPGPMRLVIEEMVTKVISVAYVPPRILNDLSSKSFEELLIERNLTATVAIEFKAKYQKRVHRDTIPVCVNPDDVDLYCECLCEHIKCCYNLFGLCLYDGDDCPSHCRSLTKSNKYMKRATYYREKARRGEFIHQNNSDSNCNSNKKVQNLSGNDNNRGSETKSRAKYTGRGSSESTSSSNISCSDQTNSRTSPPLTQGTTPICEMKENSISPDAWTIDDVARYLDVCQLSIFKSYMKSEGIDGQALLLLDKATIEEHFQPQMKSEITQEEVNKLCQLVELIKALMTTSIKFRALTDEDHKLFFEALGEHGKDFQNIQQYMAQRGGQKSNNTGTSGNNNNINSSNNNKSESNKLLDAQERKELDKKEDDRKREQIRNFYNKLYAKLSELIGKIDDRVEKVNQELYLLINYGEIWKRNGFKFNSKTKRLLEELVYHGTTTFRYEKKNVRLRTPTCKALKKINEIGVDEKVKVVTTKELPKDVIVEFHPATNRDWLKVQSLSQNPRVRARLSMQKRLTSILYYLENKWDVSQGKLNRTLDVWLKVSSSNSQGTEINTLPDVTLSNGQSNLANYSHGNDHHELLNANSTHQRIRLKPSDHHELKEVNITKVVPDNHLDLSLNAYIKRLESSAPKGFKDEQNQHQDVRSDNFEFSSVTTAASRLPESLTTPDCSILLERSCTSDQPSIAQARKHLNILQSLTGTLEGCENSRTAYEDTQDRSLTTMMLTQNSRSVSFAQAEPAISINQEHMQMQPNPTILVSNDIPALYDEDAALPVSSSVQNATRSDISLNSNNMQTNLPSSDSQNSRSVDFQIPKDVTLGDFFMMAGANNNNSPIGIGGDEAANDAFSLSLDRLDEESDPKEIDKESEDQYQDGRAKDNCGLTNGQAKPQNHMIEIKKFADGWTRHDEPALTLGELYLAFKCPEKIILEYEFEQYTYDSCYKQLSENTVDNSFAATDSPMSKNIRVVPDNSSDRILIFKLLTTASLSLTQIERQKQEQQHKLQESKQSCSKLKRRKGSGHGQTMTLHDIETTNQRVEEALKQLQPTRLSSFRRAR